MRAPKSTHCFLCACSRLRIEVDRFVRARQNSVLHRDSTTWCQFFSIINSRKPCSAQTAAPFGKCRSVNACRAALVLRNRQTKIAVDKLGNVISEAQLVLGKKNYARLLWDVLNTAYLRHLFSDVTSSLLCQDVVECFWLSMNNCWGLPGNNCGLTTSLLLAVSV